MQTDNFFKYGDKVKDLSGFVGTVIAAPFGKAGTVRVAFGEDGKSNWRDLKFSQLQKVQTDNKPKFFKLTAKRTNLLFKDMKDKRTAEDFLLKMGIPFEGIIRKPFLSVAPSKYLKNYLDLYLPEHIAGSTFNFKPVY